MGEMIIIQKRDLENLLNLLLDKKFKEIIPKEKTKKVELLTRDDVADFLKVSLTTLNGLMKQGVIPFHRVNTRIRFTKSDVDAYLVECRVKNYHSK